MGESILITGGRGMLAAAFAHTFESRGTAFTLLGKDELDIADAAAVAAAFEKHKPTIVINCAAYTKVDHCEKDAALAHRVNELGPRVLARAGKSAGARLVHFSTDYVFDGSLSRPLLPTDPIGPASAYGKSKRAGEEAILAENPAGFLILRTAWLYGPGGPNFVATMVNAARAGKTLRVVSDQVGTPTYTRDLAAAAMSLLDAKASGIFHATNSGQTNWYEFTQHILRVFNIDYPVAPITTADWFAIKPDSAIRPAYSVLDTSSLTSACDYEFRDWQAALSDYKAFSGLV